MITYVQVAVSPFSPCSPISEQKFCKNCKHFSVPPNKDQKFGRCKLFGEVNLVDGEVTYMYAGSARLEKCKGKFFTE